MRKSQVVCAELFTYEELNASSWLMSSLAKNWLLQSLMCWGPQGFSGPFFAVFLSLPPYYLQGLDIKGHPQGEESWELTNFS